MFKVVSDQLKVSQGWVRCGQCATVFDASLHLQTESPQPSALVITPTDAAAAKPTGLTVGMQPGLLNDAPDKLEVTGVIQVEPATDELNPTDSFDHVKATPYETAGADDKPADVSFVRDARRQAFWRRPVVRILLVCLALLLIIVFLLQLAVQQRDKIAAFEPELRPALQTLCVVLACSVGPVRQIDAIVIDGSSFNKLNDSVYRLTFSIKNTATHAVAMPSLEVTLTDTQDQAVIRRVLAPAQFGMVSGLLGSSTEFSGALAMQLTPPEASRDGASVARRVAGYRLLAFYP